MQTGNTVHCSTLQCIMAKCSGVYMVKCSEKHDLPIQLTVMYMSGIKTLFTGCQEG